MTHDHMCSREAFPVVHTCAQTGGTGRQEALEALHADLGIYSL